jgi:UDP-glucose 4-epimerase
MSPTIAVTEVNSYFAKTLLPKLEEDPQFDRIIGIDVTPWTAEYKKVRFFKEDIRSPRMAALLRGVDTVVHLAFIVMEIHDKKKTHQINIGGSVNVFKACAVNRVRKIIYTSSLAAYGAHPDNPIGVTEEYPLVENPDSYYSSDKVAVEKALSEFSRDSPEILVTVFRPPVILGPRVNNALVDIWKRRISFYLTGLNPQVQFLHEDDLGRALYLAVKKDVPGTFNIAPDEDMTMRKTFEIAGVRIINLPPGLMKPLANILFALRLEVMSQGWVSLMEHPIVASNQKFKQATGWMPRFTSEEAFRDFIYSRRRCAR